MSDDTPTERFSANGDDDAPTKKFPVQPAAGQPTDGSGMPQSPTPRASSDDAPTEFLGAAIPARTSQPQRAAGSGLPPASPGTPPPPASPSDADAARKRKRTITIWLIVAGVVLIAAIAVLATVLLTRDSAPTAAPTTSATPSASAPVTPSQEPQPSASQTEAPAPPPETPTTTPVPPAQGAVFTSFTPEDNTPVACPDEFSTAPLTFTWSSTGASLAWIGVDTDNAKANPHAEVDTTATYRDLGFDCSKETQKFTVTLIRQLR